MLRYDDFDIEVPDGVYEPREDTKLLADAAKQIKKKKVLELGCGCGIVSLILAKNKNNTTAADISSEAVIATKRNAERNSVRIEVIKSDLFEKVKGKYDYILFNFPYLPEKITKESIIWAAGENIELIRKFAREAKRHLNRGGKIIFVISSLTNLEKVLKIFNFFGFKCDVLKNYKLPWESLYLIEARLD